ncbi:MAG: putative hemolysin [Sphingobacteriales bacterium]|jgi:putative hemolysin
MEDKFIDVENLIGSKNPTLLKWMPGIIIRYLKRILHQFEVNQILKENKGNDGYEFCADIVKRFNLELEITGTQNIPNSGGTIFVVNHPLGGMDAMVLVEVIKNYRRDIKFIVNDLLLNLKNLKGLFVGVNKHGANTKSSMKEVNDLFTSDNAIFIFPAGLVSRKTKGEVKDLEWKKTFVSQSKKNNKPVVPVFLDGELSSFFYRLANLRRSLGLKMNLEMLYLADELFQQQNKKIKIHFGEVIPASHFDKTKNDRAWAQWVKEKVYSFKTTTN